MTVDAIDRAGRIAGLLALEPRDVVLDLGSGAGLVAERITPGVLWMHCADTHEASMEQCRARLAKFGNVETHLIPYADLGGLRMKGVSKAYSAGMFTRFNFYDLTFYLQEVHAILNVGGLLYFDFHDGDCFRYDDALDSFNAHLKIYRDVRLDRIFDCEHMGSLATLRNILPQLGFEVAAILPGVSSLTEIVVRKI
jgi:cyclopropane fatty-acyl-phospholipid synthase-like methyltransferase